MKKEISQIDVGSAALMYGAILASIGLIIGVLFLAFGSMFGSLMGEEASGMMFGGGIAMAIFFPIMYGIIGLVFGALFALLYNFLAGRIGGVKVIREGIKKETAEGSVPGGLLSILYEILFFTMQKLPSLYLSSRVFPR